MPKKQYDTDFKTRIVLEVLREEKPLSQIASESGVHPNQVRQWRNLALELWPQAFEKENRQVAQIKAEYESQFEELYAEVGRLSTRLAWAEKNLALLSRDERLALLISMDGRGRALDNIFTERLWRSLKYEEVYLHEYETPRQARDGIDRYLEMYNHVRPHQSLRYRTPAEVYRSPC